MKWFSKHRHGIQYGFIITGCVFWIASTVIAAQSIYLIGKSGFAPNYLKIPCAILFALWGSCFIISNELREYNKERDRLKIHTHNIAAGIVDEFESLLDHHDITIPDDERTGADDEARLFGDTYDKLLTNIELIVIATLSACTNEDDIEIVTDTFE